MKKLLLILALTTSFQAIGVEKDDYETMIKKEEKARTLEIEEEDKQAETEREFKHVEIKDDAGYDENNMDKVREADHKAWDAEQKTFDLPWNNSK